MPLSKFQMGHNCNRVRLPDSGCVCGGKGDFILDDILVCCAASILKSTCLGKI